MEVCIRMRLVVLLAASALAGCARDVQTTELQHKPTDDLYAMRGSVTPDTRERIRHILVDRHQTHVRDRYLSLVLDGEVAEGMNETEVEIAWGRPAIINTSRTPMGVTRYWSWRPDGSQTATFKDGALTWWHLEE